MVNTNNFKVFWWGLLVVVIGLFLYSRHEQLLEGTPNYFDTTVFLVWVAICLAPIFKEMKIFGFELKQTIEEVKKDLAHKMELMKIELQSSIEISSSNTNSVHVLNGNSIPVPAPDSEIPDIRNEIRSALRELGVAGRFQVADELVLDDGIDNKTIQLFKIRLSFEKLVNAFAHSTGTYPPRYPLNRILKGLKDTNVLPRNLVAGVNEILAVCNYAVHGEDITEKQHAFVIESAPGLYAALEGELNAAEKYYNNRQVPYPGA
jgi:hypothetical protein